MRPDFRHVEDVPPVFDSIFRRHNLNGHSPAWIFLSLDGFEKVLQYVIWIFPRHLCSFCCSEVLDSLICFDMDLHVVEGAILLCELVGVATESVGMTNRSRGSSVTEKVHEFMDTLLVVVVETAILLEDIIEKYQTVNILPEHGRIRKMCLWMALMRSIQRREFDRVSDEKYWLIPLLAYTNCLMVRLTYCIVKHPVLVALLSEEFDSPSPGISYCVCRSALRPNSGYSGEYWSFLANLG